MGWRTEGLRQLEDLQHKASAEASRHEALLSERLPCVCPGWSRVQGRAGITHAGARQVVELFVAEVAVHSSSAATLAGAGAHCANVLVPPRQLEAGVQYSITKEVALVRQRPAVRLSVSVEVPSAHSTPSRHGTHSQLIVIGTSLELFL